ncbi:MAG: class I SAM-dependent methyltransferase [Actinomycetota bacterium]|nr:class I SAM-dependent methyltransferase [Actinomycetota bacterium]
MTDFAAHEELIARFDAYYESAGSVPLRALEQRAFGCDYGGNSYTDIEGARVLLDLLGLDESCTLLDVGTGAGWPGLFLAKESGCQAILTDVAAAGLQFARARAIDEGIRAEAVNAIGTDIPFRVSSFDAVTHSDVLC